jgi:hypothetical protein
MRYVGLSGVDAACMFNVAQHAMAVVGYKSSRGRDMSRRLLSKDIDEGGVKTRRRGGALEMLVAFVHWRLP